VGGKIFPKSQNLILNFLAFAVFVTWKEGFEGADHFLGAVRDLLDTTVQSAVRPTYLVKHHHLDANKGLACAPTHWNAMPITVLEVTGS
jgi:hypothetical protein